jgi:putative spermidine/putrescine transport system substrate-binding protein
MRIAQEGMMKKRLLFRTVAITATVFFVLSGCSGDTSSPVDDTSSPVDDTSAQSADCELVMSSWGGTFTAATKEEFTDKFDSDEGCTTTIVDASGEHVAQIESQTNAGKITWDMVDSMEGFDAAYLWEQGLLEPLPEDVRKVVEDNSVPGSVTEFGVLHSTISDVIACDQKNAEACPTTPAEFFDTTTFPGPRMMMDDPLAAITWALQADGVAADEIFPADLDRAFAMLEAIKDDVRVWAASGDQQTQAFATGEVLYATMWNGRVNPTLDQGVDLAVSWEGNVFRPAYNVVVKDAPNKEVAFEYLKWFAAHGEAQAKWAERTTYGVPSKEAGDFLPPDTWAAMPTNPQNLSKSAAVDIQWYVENADELKDRWREFLGQ